MTENPWRKPCPICRRPLCAWHSPGALCDGAALTPPPAVPRFEREPLPRPWLIRAMLVAASLLTAVAVLVLWSLL